MSRSVVNAVLSSTGKNLNEVVVSALGITKQKRGLGYSISNVKPEDLTVARTTNVMNALQGKVAGVVINTLGTGPGSTSKSASGANHLLAEEQQSAYCNKWCAN